MSCSANRETWHADAISQQNIAFTLPLIAIVVLKLRTLPLNRAVRLRDIQLAALTAKSTLVFKSRG